MSSENKKVTFLERLQNTYRLVLMNDETFEEISSYRLTQLNIYLLVSTAMVIVTFLVILGIIFTPLKQYIPGYGDVHLKGLAEEHSEAIDSISGIVNAQQLYIKNIRQVFSGKFETMEDIEASTSVTVQDSLAAIKRAPADSILRQKIAQEERENFTLPVIPKTSTVSNNETSIEEVVFMAPINGSVTDGFNIKKQHFGIDITAPKNTPILSIADGVIIISDWTREAGNTIGVLHANNLVSFYKHNSKLLKKIGSFVKSGETIAIIGNTGELSSGPHLHFELWHKNKPINPTKYINF